MIRKFWEQLAIATNWPVLVAVMILASMGILSIWASDAAEAYKHNDGFKQLVFLGVSFLCMMLFQAYNYQRIGQWAWPFYVFSLGLIMYTLAARVVSLPFVHETKGVYAWLNFRIGSFDTSLEPAELMKLAFVIVLASTSAIPLATNYRTMQELASRCCLRLRVGSRRDDHQAGRADLGMVLARVSADAFCDALRCRARR